MACGSSEHGHVTLGLFPVITVASSPSVTAAWRIFPILSQVKNPIVFRTSWGSNRLTRRKSVGTACWKETKSVTVERWLVLLQEGVARTPEVFIYVVPLSGCVISHSLSSTERPWQGTFGQAQGWTNVLAYGSLIGRLSTQIHLLSSPPLWYTVDTEEMMQLPCAWHMKATTAKPVNSHHHAFFPLIQDLCVAHAGLKLRTTLLFQLPECWDCRIEPSCLAYELTISPLPLLTPLPSPCSPFHPVPSSPIKN